MGKIVKSVLTFAAFAALTVATGGANAAFLGIKTIHGAALLGGAIGGALGVLSSVLTPKPEQMREQEGYKLPERTTTGVRKLIYGHAEVAGADVFAEEYDENANNDVPNDTFVFARVVADHPVEGFGKFRLKDERVIFASNADQHVTNSGNATGKYAGKLYLRTQDGWNNTSDGRLQAASSGWTSEHVGEGLAYYTLKAKFDPELFPYGVNSVHNCTIEVYGKRVYDPRLDSTLPGGSGTHRLGDPTTWEYSTNPALCIYDYLRDDILGNPVPDEEISTEAIIAAANICDEEVATAGGTTIKRYSLNGVVSGGRDKFTNVQTMLTAMAGRIMWLGGEIHIFAASERTSTHLLNEDVILSASYDPLPPVDQRYNEVRGTFISPADRFNPQEYPPLLEAAEQALEGERALSLYLPFTQDHRIAQRLAKIALVNSRQPLLNLEVMPAAAQFAPMDVVAISWANFGLVGEDFRIISQRINGGKDGRPLTVSLGLMREEGSAYAWDAATEEQPRGEKPALTVVDPTLRPAPTGVQVDSNTITTTDGSKQTSLLISWDTPNILVSSTHVDYRLAGTTTWYPAGASTRGDTDLRIFLPPAQSYEVQVRHQYNSGLFSESVRPEAEATETLDGVGRYVHRGAYNPATQYVAGDVVTFEGSSYLYIAASPASGIPVSNAGYWTLMAQAGEDGAPGPQGVPGEPGANGQTTYTWIRYADDENGGGLSNDPLGKTYIGLAYNKLSATESSNPADYQWSLVVGPKGNAGVEGPAGEDGQTTYTWIKYSANSNGSGLTDTPQSNTRYIGIAVNKTTEQESTNRNDYTWSLYRGEDGQDGEDGYTITASPTSHTIAATSAGVILAGALPVTSQVNLFQGSVNRTSAASYTRANSNCIAQVSSSGLVTISSLTADSGYVDVTASHGGITLVSRITLVKVKQGANATSVEANLVMATSSSYMVIGGPVALTMPGGGAINANASLLYNYSPTNETQTIKIQYSADGTSYSDMAPPGVGDPGMADSGLGGASAPGSAHVNVSNFSGPSNNATWHFRVVGKFNGGNSGIYQGGEGSVMQVSWS